MRTIVNRNAKRYRKPFHTYAVRATHHSHVSYIGGGDVEEESHARGFLPGFYEGTGFHVLYRINVYPRRQNVQANSMR